MDREGPDPATGRKIDHWPALDGLRGVAVLLVLAGHADLIFGDVSRFEAFRGGRLGVDIFFVLSGCLITMLLLAEEGDTGRVRLSAFYARRALRLLPAMFCAIVLVGIFDATVSEAAGGRSFPTTVALVVGYVGNWAQAYRYDYLGWLGHAWTLSIEEQFYLLWPLALALLLRRHTRTSRMLFGIGVGIAISVAYRAMEVGAGRLPNNEYHTFARADALLIGCALAILLRRRPHHPSVRWLSAKPAGAAACLALGGVIVATQLRPSMTTVLVKGGFTLFALAAAVLIGHCVLEPGPVGAIRRVLSAAPLRILGRVSYGLYLYHFPIFLAVHETRLRENHAVELVVALALTAVTATVSFVVVERPMLRLKKRFERPGVRVPVAGADETAAAPAFAS